MFLANVLDLSPLQVTELYKKKWQVALFFKWFKQHLKTKKFWVISKIHFTYKSILQLLDIA